MNRDATEHGSKLTLRYSHIGNSPSLFYSGSSLPLGSLPNSDGVDMKDLLADRPALRPLIKDARSYFQGLLDVP